MSLQIHFCQSLVGLGCEIIEKFATVMAISHLDIILYTQAKTLVELGKTPLPPKFTKVYLLMCAGEPIFII